MATAYIFYNSPQSVKSIDRNKVRGKITEFPRGLYVGESLNPSKCQPFGCSGAGGVAGYVRDPEIDYFFGTEKTQHPAHFSRFGYAWCPNGYCTGNHPGRYNTPPGEVDFNSQPKGMAPERFYSDTELDPFYTLSPAYIDSFNARGR